MSYELRTAKLSVALFIFGCQGWLSLKLNLKLNLELDRELSSELVMMLPSISVHAIATREQEQVVPK